MVIYGYGMSLDEQDLLEEISFRRRWEQEENRIYATLNGEDREILIRAY